MPTRAAEFDGGYAESALRARYGAARRQRHRPRMGNATGERLAALHHTLGGDRHRARAMNESANLRGKQESRTRSTKPQRTAGGLYRRVEPRGDVRPVQSCDYTGTHLGDPECALLSHGRRSTKSAALSAMRRTTSNAQRNVCGHTQELNLRRTPRTGCHSAALGVYAGTPENSVAPAPPSTFTFLMRSARRPNASFTLLSHHRGLPQRQAGEVSLADRGMDITTASGELTFPHVRRLLRNINVP